MLRVITSVILVIILLVMYFCHVHLLIKAIQCSSSIHLNIVSFHKMQLHDRFLFGSMDDSRDDRQTSPNCIFVTFLSEYEMVLVDFELDCITKIYQDGSFEISGFDCKNVFARTFLKIILQCTSMSEKKNPIFYIRRKEYICVQKIVSSSEWII